MTVAATTRLATASPSGGGRGKPWSKSQIEKPYGFLVTYEARVGGLLSQKTFRAKCCESQARTKCLFREGFIRVVRLEPLTAAEWEKPAPARHYDRSLAGGRR